LNSELLVSRPENPQSFTATVEVIVNVNSGVIGNDELPEQLKQLFTVPGISAHISIAQSGDDITRLAREAAASDCEIVVAGGGDGTVSTVAAELAGTQKVLGILPLGTLNHFAKDLKIPLELEEAVQIIINGQISEVDVGEVNGNIFINNSSLGLYPSIVRERQKQQRLGHRKWPAFVWAAVTVLRRYPFLSVRLSVGDQEFASRTPFVFIGNNEYQMESFHIGSRACLNAGKLSLYMSHRTSRWGLVRLAFRALFGGLRQERDFTALCSDEIWIETRKKSLSVAMDGEVKTLNPPLHYRVRPRALKVKSPALKVKSP
jgi:diacylglycerol kinase family enzyme